MKEFIAKNLKWMILIFCLISFVALAGQVFSKEMLNIDVMGYKAVSDFLISDFVTPIAKFITSFGGAITLGGITVILFVVIKNRRIGTSIVINLGMVVGLNLLLKQIWQRPRPTEYRIINETGYSFPSGHSMVSMAFYGFLIYLIYKHVKNRALKIGLITLLSILIILIGVSRIYLGVHYTSDVMAGFLLSISYLIIYISIVNQFMRASS